MRPSGLTARMFGRGTALVFAIFARVTGVDMLGELSTFFRSLSGVLDGFGERTRKVSALLRGAFDDVHDRDLAGGRAGPRG